MTHQPHQPVFDKLEVVLRLVPGTPRMQTLALLQHVVDPFFEVEPIEQLDNAEPGAPRQVVRFAATTGERFASLAQFESRLRELVGHDLEWQRVGAVRAREALTS